MTVTLLGADGNCLDQIGLILPILARYTSSPLIEKPPILNLADCLLVFFLNLGVPTFLPLRLPLSESKKFL